MHEGALQGAGRELREERMRGRRCIVVAVAARGLTQENRNLGTFTPKEISDVIGSHPNGMAF